MHEESGSSGGVLAILGVCALLTSLNPVHASKASLGAFQ